jgi:flagellar biosynthesis/type III secretory pathway protein FliH
LQKPKREKKKPKQLREAEKAHNANIYSEGYKHGYEMGLQEGMKRAKI